MAARQEAAQVTCPQQTQATAPVEVPLLWAGGIIRHIEIVIPAGHSGLTGIALGYGHNMVIPRTGRNFYSGDDDVFRFDYKDNNPGVAWSAFLCNLDLQQHVWEVRFELDEVGADTPQASQPAFITQADMLTQVVTVGGP